MATKNTKGSTKMRTPSALKWFKNVSRSLGYTSVDLVNEMMPATIDFATSNVDTVKELYTELRQLKTKGRRAFNFMENNEYADIARTSIKNAIKDVKSGNIYNKDRQEKIFQGDDDFGMGDFGFDEEAEVGGKTQPIHITQVEGNINKNNPMVKAVDRQTKAILTTSQVTNDLGVSLATSSLISDKKIGKGIMQGLDGINNNLALLVNFQSESMTKYISASISYYESNLQVLNDTLLEIKKNSPQIKDTVVRKNDNLDSAFLSRGGLDLKGYGKMVWKQLGNAIDSNMFLAPIKNMLQDKDTLKFLAASPLSFISTKIVTSLIPNLLKSAMTDMDKSFQSFFPAMLMKINRLSFKSDNPILQLFGQVFGANVKMKSSVDLSTYSKGPVAFDGYVKKSITDVIPTYLRKILAALTSSEELGFDYDKGVFKSVHNMKKDFNNQADRTILNQFGDAISEIKDRANSFYIEDVAERKKFYTDIDSFFTNLAKSNYLVNPLKTHDKNGNKVDELADVFKFKGNQQEFFRQLILSLPKNMQMKMFGSDVINARQSKNKFMIDAEENPLLYNASNIFNGSDTDQHLSRDPRDKSKFTVKKGGGLLPVDVTGFNSLDYLRDIKRILLHGIVVFPKYNMGTGDSGTTSQTPSYLSDNLEKMIRQNFRAKRTPLRPTVISTSSEVNNRREHGQRTVDSLSNSELGSSDFSSQIQTYVSERDRNPGQDQDNNVFKWAGKFFKGNAQDKYNMIREKVDNLFQAPVKLLSGVFKKIDSTMYEMVFGKAGANENTSFLSKTFSLLKIKFATFSTWMKNEVFLPIKNALLGPDGLLTKLKNSSLFNSIKGKASQLANYLFGNPTGENGARENGLFSQTANSLLDIWDGAKYYFTGKGYTNRSGQRFSDNNNSVLGELKSMFVDFKGNLKEYLFGKKDTNNPDRNKKGVFSGIIDSVGKGFQNFSDALFGPQKINGRINNNHIVISDLNKKIKERAPKALAIGLLGGAAGLLLGGKLGILGSLLLPGGPIGGAVVATTIGFLSQSDRFKNWLFGPKGLDGVRIGGFISKATSGFLIKNKVGIIGGASVGAMRSLLSSFGVLPSFFLPGGIVGGAIMGVGTSLLVRSEGFQKLMFGEKDQDGKRHGGVVDKLFGQFRKGQNKNLFGNIGAGAVSGATLGMITSKFGLMGAMLLPGGPIGGALLGAAAGIALSSDKWRKALFGEFDADTQLRKGGLFGKFINWTKLEVMAPLKLKFSEINMNIQKWFGESIANPFLNALEPLKHEMTLMIRSLKDTFVQGWKNFQVFLGTSFEKFVGMPFGQFMKKNVLDPLKGFLRTLLGGIGKIFGPLLSAPVRALEGISEGLMARHKEKGVVAYRKKRGFLGSIKDSIFNRQAIEDARNSAEGAPYAKELEAAKAKRAADTADKYARKKADLDQKWGKLNRRRGIGLDNDYDNVDRNGLPIHDVYRTHDTPNNPVEESNNRIAVINNVPNQQTSSQSNVINMENYRQSRNNTDNQIPPTTQTATPVTHQGQSQQTRPNLSLVPPIQRTEQSGPIPQIPHTNQTNTESSPQTSNYKRSTQIEVKPQVVNQMAADIKIIAQEVKGQLDGVGSNVFKIRKLLQQQGGIDDKDLEGSANRDRVGFLGKIRRALYKPFSTAKELLMKPIRFVGDKLKTLGTVIKNVGKAILKVPVDIVKGVFNFGKELLKVGKETFLALVKLPVALVKTVGFALQTVAETMKIVGPAIGESLKGVAKLFSGAMGLAAHAMIGFGKGLGEILFGIGEGVGQIVKGVGKAIGNAVSGTVSALFKMVPLVTDFLFKTTGTIADFTLNVVTKVGEKLMDIGATLFQIVTSPIKFLATAVGKIAGMKSEVTIAGGTLDLVKEVSVLKINNNTKELSATGTDGKSIRSSHVDPMPVRIVSSDTIPVIIVSTKHPKTSGIPIPDISSRNPISNVIDRITNSLPGGLDIFGNSDNTEDINAKRDQAQKLELANEQKQVSRRTASFTIAQHDAAEEKTFLHDNESQQTTLLGAIAGYVKDHRDNWLGMFGKTGLITMAALMALPYLKKLFDWFMGKPSGDNGNIDGNGNTVTNLDKTEHMVRAGAYVAKGALKTAEPVLKGGAKLAKVTGKVVSKTGQLVKKAGSSILNLGGEAAPAIEETGAKVVSLGEYKANKALGKTTSVAIEDSTKVVDAAKNSNIDKVLKTIKDMMAKLFEYLGGKFPKASKAFSAITKVVDKVFTRVVIERTMPRWMSGLARIGGSLATGEVLDAAFVGYGLITGWFEAAHLFRVQPDQVDYIMKAISSAMKGILNFSWFFLINIANDVFIEATQGNSAISSVTNGTGFLEMIANYLYAALAGDEKSVTLSTNQAASEKARLDYNTEHNTTLTQDSYNSMMNPTVADRVVNGAKAIGNGLSYVGNGIVNNAKWIGGKIADGASYVGNGIVNNAKWAGNKVAEFVSMDDNSVRKNLNLSGDGTISTGMRLSSGIAGGLETASFGLIDSNKTAQTIYGMGVSAQESMSNIKKDWDTFWDGAGKSAGKIWTDMKKSFNDSVNGVKKDWDKFWDDTGKDAGTTWSLMKTDWDSATAGLKKDWDNFWGDTGKNASTTWSLMKTGWNSSMDVISKEFDNVGTDISKSVHDGLGYIGSFFGNLGSYLKDVFNDSIVGKNWNALVNFFTGSAVTAERKAGFNSEAPSRVGGKGGFGGGFGEAPSKVNNFSYFSQADDRWANVPYDYSPGKGHSPDPALEKRGCGPTSAAMVVSQLTGKNYTPPQMAQIAQQDGFSTDQGTSWGYFNDIAKKFSMQALQIDPSSDKNTFKTMLDAGVPVVLSGIRPGTSSSSDSPFTSAGHFVVAVGNDGANKVKINDPRGEQYSHSYDINTVLNQSKQGWGFKYDGGPTPDTISPVTSIKSDKYSTDDLFGKLSELIGLYTDNTFFGTNKQLSWGTDDTGSPIQAPSGDIDINFIPKSLQDAILKKTAEETIKHESGGNYTFARNDVNGTTGESISPSIGALQWRGGYAKILMQNIAKQLPGNSEANYFANKVNWTNNTPWSNAEQKRLQDFLNSNSGIAKSVEDSMILGQVKDTNLSQVYKYGVIPKKISDPRSIAFLGDFANTGPANIQSFMSAYSPTSATGKTEFDHLYDEFKAKSYWGQHQGIYSGRMQELYSDLAGWDPEQGGYGTSKVVGGGFGDLTNAVASKLLITPANSVNTNNLSLPTFSSENSPAIRSYIRGTQSIDGGSNDDLLAKAIQVLQLIASNTGDTVSGVRSLANMKIQVDVKNNPITSTNDNPTQNNIIVTPGQNTSINPFIDMATNNKNKTQAKNYDVAKSMARGRIS